MSLEDKDPFDMNLMELKEERSRLRQKSWKTRKDHDRADLINELIKEKEREATRAAKCSIQTMF